MRKDRLDALFNLVAPNLVQGGLDGRTIKDLYDRVKQEMQEIPDPTIAFIGFAGVGKSSTLNALFNAGQAVSDVRPGTKDPQAISGNIEKYTGSKGSINVYDMPGLGESITKDRQHIKRYEQTIPLCDVVVWTFRANDRVMTPTQEAILSLIDSIGPEFTKHLLFAVNKADIIEPGESEWNEQANVPSPAQQQNIRESENYIREKIKEILPAWNGQVVTYSAKRRYHLEQLMTAMVQAMPEKKRWTLDDRADVADYTALMDPEYLEYAISLKNNRQIHAGR